MNLLRELVILILGTVVYVLGLSFSIYERGFQKKLAARVLLGVFAGFTLAASIVEILVQVTQYDQLPSPIVVLVYAPIVEELMKFLTIYCLGFLLHGTISKFEMTRLSGGVGLGFGSMETLGRIISGATYTTILRRFVVTSPFHISSALLIGTGLTERKLVILLPAAIAFHTLSNLLAFSTVLVQGILSWATLSILYCFSEIGHTIDLRGWIKSRIRVFKLAK